MRIVNIEEEKKQADFALRAAKAMKDNPRLYTFADSDPTPGKLLAIRWNPYTVLVIKLDESHVPSLYPTQDANMIKSDLPPLQGEPSIPRSL